MNSHYPTRDSAADEQAALWAARLDGSTLTASDRDELDTWLAASPAHRALLSQYCQFSTDLEADLPALVARGSLKMPRENESTRSTPRGFFNVKWFASVAFAAAAAVAVILWSGRPATQTENVATAVAQRQAITLADGTRVELNARTTMRVELTRTERRIRLAEGQAFFTVTKDPARPFIVETPAGSVRVTGTTFDVRSGRASELHVTVVEGSVLVRPGESGNLPPAGPVPVSLRAGDYLTATAGSATVTRLSAAAIEDVLAWRQGAVVFDGVPLELALARFAHHHGRGINVLEGAAAHRLGGRYSIDDLDGFVGMLDQAFPVEVTHGLSGTITIAPRKAR